LLEIGEKASLDTAKISTSDWNLSCRNNAMPVYLVEIRDPSPRPQTRSCSAPRDGALVPPAPADGDEEEEEGVEKEEEEGAEEGEERGGGWNRICPPAASDWCRSTRCTSPGAREACMACKKESLCTSTSTSTNMSTSTSMSINTTYHSMNVFSTKCML
jgi:hypothetical protein